MKENDSETLLEPKTEKGPNVEIQLYGRQPFIYIYREREAAAGLDLFLKWDVLDMAIFGNASYNFFYLVWFDYDFLGERYKVVRFVCVCVCVCIFFIFTLENVCSLCCDHNTTCRLLVL